MNVKKCLVVSAVAQVFCIGCVSVSTCGLSGASAYAFYPGTELESSSLWESVLNDALSKRAFVLYSSHTMAEYSMLTRLEGTWTRHKIYRPGKNVALVCDFPQIGEITRFAVHDDPVRKRILIVETGACCQVGQDEISGESFDVDVKVSENLVKHYIKRSYNPIEVYPFFAEAVKKAFRQRAGFCLVASMVRTDSGVLVYTCNGFWRMELPLVSDVDDIKLFREHPEMFVRCVESFPDVDFWDSDNLRAEEVCYWHSYLLKLFEQGLWKSHVVNLDKNFMPNNVFGNSGDKYDKMDKVVTDTAMPALKVCLEKAGGTK